MGTILLVTVFQCYWINRLYKEEKENLRKETDVLFRDAVYKLQLQRLKKDSVLAVNDMPDNLFAFDVMKGVAEQRKGSLLPAHTPGDSGKKRFVISMRMRNDASETGLLFDSPGIAALPVPTAGSATAVQVISNGNVLSDSLPLNKIDSSYKAELHRNNIFLPYTISFITGNTSQSKPPAPIPDKLQTNFTFVGLSRFYAYQASFDNPSAYIFGKLRLPILVSVLLVIFTTVSFIFLYRNLLAQQRLSAMKNEFISNVTHELKTPIATVNVAVEALRNFNALEDPVKTKEYLDISASELQRLSLLVDKVLKLSMFESKVLALEKTSFDLRSLTEEVMAMMRLQFEKQDALVSMTTTGEHFTILADRTHMASVLYNLLDNALKYAKDQPRIEISLHSKNMHVEVSVKDNGIGIPAEYKTRVFEKFFRVPADNVHNTKGYGLGLSYVRHILQRHMGFIQVESEPGKGSVFTAYVPYREADTIYFDDKRIARKREISLLRKRP